MITPAPQSQQKITEPDLSVIEVRTKIAASIRALSQSPATDAARREEISAYKGPMTVDASLLHALWCYGALQPIKNVVYSYGAHQKCLDDADKLISDRASALAAGRPRMTDGNAPVARGYPVTEPLRQLFADHYWDSFQGDKDIVMKHIESVLLQWAAALRQRAENCAKYDFDSVEMIECKWELWDEILAALSGSVVQQKCARCGSVGDTYVLCSGCGGVAQGAVSCGVTDQDKIETLQKLVTEYKERAIEVVRAETAAQGKPDCGAEAQFLLDRLDEFDPGEADAEREYHGHVAPAIARLRSALSSTDKTGAP